MGPLEPSDEGIFSKLLFFGALALLLVILAGCVYFIYGFVNPPQDGSSFPTPTPTPLPTPTVVVTPTPTFTPTPRLTPTLQIEPTPEPTATPVVQYIFDTRVTEGVKVLTPSGIWGNYIVYDRMIRNNNYEVHLYNLRSLSDIVIASGNVRSFGAIGSGKVALLNGDDKSIKLYDIEHKDTLQATPAKSIPREFPHIFDDLLIYSGNEGGTNEVVGKIDIFSLYTYRMSDGLYSMWAVNVPQPREPRGYGNYLVWWTLVDGKKEVILYDIKKVSSQKIADGGDHPRIYDNIVVYHGADHHIYLYDISTGKTRQLLTFGRQYTADIYGSKIVYDDNRDGNWDIYLFDLATGKETQVTNEPHDQMSPQIYGEDVIYMDNRNSQDGSWEVYTIRI